MVNIKYCEHSSACEVKNNCCSCERLFKVKKNAIILFGIPFFVSEIFAFSYYANEESDDVIGALKLYITKEGTWHLLWHCHDNSYATGPVSIETKINRFCLKQGSSTHNNLMRTMCVLSRTLCPTLKGCKWGYLVFTERLGPRVLPWQQQSRCQSVSFAMYISGVKFEEHCSNSSGDILDSVLVELLIILRHHHSPHLHNTKMWISLKQKRYPKRKTPFFFILKAFKISNNYFFTSLYAINVQTEKFWLKE